MGGVGQLAGVAVRNRERASSLIDVRRVDLLELALKLDAEVEPVGQGNHRFAVTPLLGDSLEPLGAGPGGCAGFAPHRALETIGASGRVSTATSRPEPHVLGPIKVTGLAAAMPHVS